VFTKMPSSVTEPGATVPLPGHITQSVDYEAELTVVIGKGGRTIKIIGETARLEMEKLFGCRVHLFLHTKVAAAWGETPSNYREWGLEFPKDQ
jgi:GTP-binding protein Era